MVTLKYFVLHGPSLHRPVVSMNTRRGDLIRRVEPQLCDAVILVLAVYRTKPSKCDRQTPLFILG